MAARIFIGRVAELHQLEANFRAAARTSCGWSFSPARLASARRGSSMSSSTASKMPES
jgi:hypothetical protein